MDDTQGSAPSAAEELKLFAGRYGGAVPATGMAPGSALRLAWDIGCRALDETVGRAAGAPGTIESGGQEQGTLTLAGGDRIALAILDRDTLNGVAGREGGTSFAAIFAALPATIAEIAAAIWSDPRCLHWIGDVSSLPPPPAEGGETPPGFELLRLAAASDREPLQPEVARYLRTAGLSAIAAGHGRLCPARTAGLAQTVADALHFVWLHEIAHVVLGHVDGSRLHLAAEALLELEMAEPASRPPERKVNRTRQTLEVMADDFALRLLFSHRYGEFAQLRTQPGPQPPSLDRIAIATVAAAIVPLALHAAEFFSGRPSPVIWHPPLWFRAQRILALEAMAYRDASDALSVGTGTRTELLDPQERYRALAHNSAALMSLTRLHPLVADWIGPMQEEERRRLANRFLEDIRTEAAASPLIRGLRPKLSPQGRAAPRPSQGRP